LWRAGENENSDFKKGIAKDLFAKKRFFVPIVVKGQESDGPKIWGFSEQLFTDTIYPMWNTILEMEHTLNDPRKGGYVTIIATPKSKENRFGKISATIHIPSWTKPTPLAPTDEEMEEIINAVPNITEDLFSHATEEELIEAFKEFVDSKHTVSNSEHVDETDSEQEGEIDESHAHASEAQTAEDVTNTISEEDLEDALKNILRKSK